jgi:hypothetical protein
VIGTWEPSNAEFTLEKIAVVSAMAGAKPEYMPVIVAALKAITSVPWDAYFPVMRAPVPLVIANGPYARKIGINSSSNAFAPNPKYSANGAIGRAINLALEAIPGNGRGIKPSLTATWTTLEDCRCWQNWVIRARYMPQPPRSICRPIICQAKAVYSQLDPLGGFPASNSMTVDKAGSAQTFKEGHTSPLLSGQVATCSEK